MADKTTIVSPEGARTAGCSADCDSYHSGVIPPSYQGGATYAYTNYQVVATGAGNWRPKLINVTHSYTYSDGSTGGETIPYRSSDYGDANPWNFPAVKEFSDWENPYEYTETDPGTETRLRTVNDTITGVEVVFEEGTPTTTYTASASANPSGWGTVKVGSAAVGSTSTLTNITAGSTVTVVATPETGYHFVSWSDGGAQTHDVTVNSDINLTATFEADTPPVGIVTIVISAHNGWGEVSFDGESWTSGALAKTVFEGSSVTVMARQTYQYGPVFFKWDSPTMVSSESTFTFTATASTTVTAYFGYFVRYSASKVSDPTRSAPVGQVRILADGIVSHWTDNSYQYVLDSNTITVEQRSLPVGWQFVKWYYKREYDANWFESISETLTLGVDRWYIYAAFNCTDLLINSSTVESPAKLVYYPATNKLVADY